MMQDYQKSKVYKWENETIHPHQKETISFDNAQAFVDGIWLANGWLYPPKTILRKATANTWADANREQIRIPHELPKWVLLHELAHTLTCTVEKDTDRHGPDFVGLYIKLLEQVLNIPSLMLMYSLSQRKIDYNLGAIPWFQKKTKRKYYHDEIGRPRWTTTA